MTSHDFNTAVAIVICAFIGSGLFVLWTQRKSRTPPAYPMATRKSWLRLMWERLKRAVSQRRMRKDLGWRRGWDHIRG